MLRQSLIEIPLTCNLELIDNKFKDIDISIENLDVIIKTIIEYVETLKIKKCLKDEHAIQIYSYLIDKEIKKESEELEKIEKLEKLRNLLENKILSKIINVTIQGCNGNIKINKKIKSNFRIFNYFNSFSSFGLIKKPSV